jgi:glycosyltransferase involved in cell wall biosynthesis
MIKKDFPLVTIGVPVFNDFQFIQKCLDSLLSQTYKNIKIFISDDLSTDGSQEICKRYAVNHSNIHYHRQTKNIGISKNMNFLLANCTSDYFMWAANDDVWAANFIELLVKALEKNIDSVVAFGPYVFISEQGDRISDLQIEDYSGVNSEERLKKLILSPRDGFGYGLFRTNQIKGVKFPNWIWPNHKCAYNNIYPTLLFYLSKGQFCYVQNDEPIWFNRIKYKHNINHKLPFTNSWFILCFISYLLRKINLIFFSIFLLLRIKNNTLVVCKIFPRLFFSWFLIPVFLNVHLKYYAFKEKRFEVFI